MIDIEKLLAEIEKVKLIIQSNRAQGAFTEGYLIGQESILEHFDRFVKSLQKEPVSEDMEEAFKTSLKKVEEEIINYYDYHAGFVDGAQWKREQMMAKTIDVTLYPKYNEIWVDVFEILKGFDDGERAKIIILK